MPDVGLWHRCNSHCLMCTNMDSYIEAADRQYDLRSQLRKLARLTGGGRADYVLFTGGEPTLHPDFMRLMAEYRKALPGLPFSLLTNGRALAYGDRARKVLAIMGRPLCVAVPIHGGDAKSHDSITRAPGSFQEAVEGLKNLLRWRAHGQEIEIRVVLHKRTCRDLGRLLDFLLREFPDTGLYRLTLMHFEAEGQAEKNFESLRLSLTDCASQLERSLDALRRFAELRLYHFPLCVLPEPLRSHAWKTLPAKDAGYLRKCRPCVLKRDCLGVPRWYARKSGEAEIRPLAARGSA